MKHRRGFTLLELILASAVMAMLMLALYSSLGAAFKARNAAERQGENTRRMAIILDIVENDLRSVLPPKGTLAGPMVGYPTGGGNSETHNLNFYTLTTKGMQRVQYTVNSSGSTQDLQRSVITNLLSPTATQAQSENLTSECSSFVVRYYDGAGWSTQWDSTQTNNILPVAIKVTVSIVAANDTVYQQSRLIPMSCGYLDTSSTSTGGIQ